jgi:hypothetical protein
MADRAPRLLPTHPDNGRGDAVDFLDAFRNECRQNSSAKQLLIVTYAASLKGWKLIQRSVNVFRTRKGKRVVRAYVGLDHLLTHPDALKAMQKSGIAVKTVSSWPDVFHPKLFAFIGGEEVTLLVGSNNLTHRGMQSNYEFALRVVLSLEDAKKLSSWLAEIDGVAKRLTVKALGEYLGDFQGAQNLRRTVPAPRERIRQLTRQSVPVERRFSRAIVEVMPRETGTQGTQIQMPMEVVRAFFGMEAGKESTAISVVNDDDNTGTPRSLTLTDFQNNTARLSLSEVNFQARPCVIELWWEGVELRFRVVRQATNGSEYSRLLKSAMHRTRKGSKRFALLR